MYALEASPSDILLSLEAGIAGSDFGGCPGYHSNIAVFLNIQASKMYREGKFAQVGVEGRGVEVEVGVLTRHRGGV